MALKDSCPTLAKVRSDEPIFVLRAQDKLAPGVIRTWARMLSVNAPRDTDGRIDAGTQAKINEAEACAASMEKWPRRKYPD
jgi:hypothetical protein